MDKTVEALWQQFRNDVPQGEKAADVVQHQPEETTPQFIPMPEGQREPTHQAPSGDAGVDHESREVPPSPDEPGLGETRQVPQGPPGGFDYGQDDDRVDNVQEAPGMEVDAVTIDEDLRDVMNVMTRDTTLRSWK